MSKDSANVYEREKLYEEVWSTPVIHVAKLYGVSNVAIKKICKSMNIPTPPNGYWAKLRHGKEVHKITLPMHLNGQSKLVECDRRNIGDAAIKFKYGSISFLTHDEQETFKEILSLFTTAADQLLSSFSCDRDIMNRMHGCCITSDEQKERAIEIINYVIAGLVKLGGRINDDTSLDIRSEDITFHLIEQISKATLIQNEQKKTQCDYERNGKLVFEIHNYGKKDMRIGDTPKRKLEDRIPEIIYKFLQISEERRNTHLDTLEIDLAEKKKGVWINYVNRKMSKKWEN